VAEREVLSKTQVEVVRHLSRGLTNREIAEQRSITVGTTKWHLHQIYRELRVRNRTAAVAKARQLGLL
jgi:LuxR family maltose regulon positive regulatory protein